jgi:hypothetical protein
MANDIPLPADPEGFDRFFESSLASMAPDIEPALLAEIMPQIDAWRQQQAEPPSRSDAIRRLIEAGLQATMDRTPPWPTAPGWTVAEPAPLPPDEPITPTEADEVR